jgi:hypothetical protein
MSEGIYQGWDLHPAQLPVRHAACVAFFQSGLAEATLRVRNFLACSGTATRVQNRFDDEATAHGFLTFFRRGLACGAITEGELESAGLVRSELELETWAEILRSRAARENLR